MTAHFWATDGIAALGLFGVLLASGICALLFWVIDSLSQRHDPQAAALVMFYAVYSLANLSIFTTFLSGGLGLLIILLYLMPPEEIVRLREPVSATRLRLSRARRSGPLPIPKET